MTSRNEPEARQRLRKRRAEMGKILLGFSYIPVVRFTLNPKPEAPPPNADGEPIRRSRPWRGAAAIFEVLE